MVSGMCQYNDRCPTTRHRPGTQCPVEVRDRNREDRLVSQLWGLVVIVAIFGLALGYYWFYLREGATGLGFAPMDNLFLRSVTLTVMPPTWVR